jgi:hypothetical protein
VYEKMDEALAEHVERIDPGATLLVLMSNGMGPHHDGTHLLPEILRRLDQAHRFAPQRSLEGRILGRAWMLTPTWLRGVLIKPLAAMLRARARRSHLPPARDSETDDERRAQAFFMSPNNFVVGGVRVNVAGREKEGFVRPGNELDETYRRLASDLLALVNVEAGVPVIKRVERSDAHYERGPLDALPDLFLEWNHDQPIETVWSPRFGIIHGPYTHWRTGDHRPGGLLLVRRPGLEPEQQLPALEINRLAAMIAEQLGAELPESDRAADAGVAAAG